MCFIRVANVVDGLNAFWVLLVFSPHDLDGDGFEQFILSSLFRDAGILLWKHGELLSRAAEQHDIQPF